MIIELDKNASKMDVNKAIKRIKHHVYKRKKKSFQVLWKTEDGYRSGKMAKRNKK